MPTNQDNPAKKQNARDVLAMLKSRGDLRIREQMSKKFGITGHSASTAYGIRVGELRALAKSLRGRGKSPTDAARNHKLALELWNTGNYEARLLAAFVDVPALVTRDQMDRWAKDFDNWAVCDTACFCLFDRVDPKVAYGRIGAWAKSKHEFVKRGAFAMLASLALHDKTSGDAMFEKYLPLIERGANDERNFVKKAVSWALRGIGKRNKGLNLKCVAVSKRLAASDDRAARWVGKDALRDLVPRTAQS